MYEYFIILHDRDYIQTHCNDRRNTFSFRMSSMVFI